MTEVTSSVATSKRAAGSALEQFLLRLSRGVDTRRGDVGVCHPAQPRTEPNLPQREPLGEIIAEEEAAIDRPLKPAAQAAASMPRSASG